MKSVSAYLNFPGKTEEAFEFYRSVFGGEFTNVTRFRDMGENTMGLSEKELDGIANIGLPITPDVLLMGTDVVPAMGPVHFGNNFYIALETDTLGECDEIFAKLSKGGNVEMEPQRTDWAEKYGSFEDRYGVRWMVMYTGNVQFG